MTDLSPELRAWIDAAGDEVVRYMRGQQMKLITPSAALKAAQRREAALSAASDKSDKRKPVGDRQLSEHQRQVIAGVEMGLSDTVMARNIKLTPPRLKRMREKLKRMGFL
jgi:FixJ family two-component response regulator